MLNLTPIISAPSFTQLCLAVVREESLSARQFAMDLLPHLLHLVTDPVPNVRVTLAKSMYAYMANESKSNRLGKKCDSWDVCHEGVEREVSPIKQSYWNSQATQVVWRKYVYSTNRSKFTFCTLKLNGNPRVCFYWSAKVKTHNVL